MTLSDHEGHFSCLIGKRIRDLSYRKQRTSQSQRHAVTYSAKVVISRSGTVQDRKVVTAGHYIMGSNT